MEIDGATRRNLELLESMIGDKGASLLSVVDRTVTGAGARLLANRIANPLLDIEEINKRLDIIEFLTTIQTSVRICARCSSPVLMSSVPFRA